MLDFLVYDARGITPIDAIQAESSAAAAKLASVMWGRTPRIEPAKWRPYDFFLLAFRAHRAEAPRSKR